MDVRKALKRWRTAMASLFIAAVLSVAFPRAGREALSLLGMNVGTILGILPPVFVLLGLFDAWVPRERVAPHLGETSGLKGIILAILLGASSAGPLYIAFPVAEVMIRKGTSLRNAFIFLGAWSTMRVPMILFEIQNLGAIFALSRYGASLAGVLLMGAFMERVLGPKDREDILARFAEHRAG